MPVAHEYSDISKTGRWRWPSPPPAWVALAARSSSLIWPILCGALLLLQTVLIVQHAPWHDEWHALMIVIQSRGWPGLLENLRYEAHAPLWYALLDLARWFVPARLSLVAVQLPIALALQALILFGSPFARWQRLCIAASFFVLIDYGTISRSLSLGALAAAIGASARGRRTGTIALAVMPAIDMIFGILSLPFVLLRLRERQLWLPGFALWIFSGLATAWMLRPAPDMVPAMRGGTLAIEVLSYLANLSALLLPLHWGDSGPVWNSTIPLFPALILGPLFIRFAIRQLAGRPVDRALLIGFIGLTALFSVAIYPLPIRYLSLIAWLLILLQWRMVARGGIPDRAFRIWIAVAAACGLLAATINLLRPFHNASAAADYIRNHNLSGETWTVFPEYKNESLTALSGIEFVRLGANCTQTFMRWDRRPIIEDIESLDRSLKQLVAVRGQSYLLSSFDLGARFPRQLVRPLAVIPPGYDGQTDYLYVIGQDQPKKTTKLPPCSRREVPLLPLTPLG